MTDRIIDISGQGSHVALRNGCICISNNDHQTVSSIPVAEVGVLLLSNPAISLTQPALAELLTNGGIVVICGKDHAPCGMTLPFDGHHMAGRVIRTQAAVRPTTNRRLWQQIVRAKIRNQARLLKKVSDTDGGLSALVGKVKSGDPHNIEARAARVFWRELFTDTTFHRVRDGGGINDLLNYGYMVLRAMVSHAICAAGLHPSFGLHHHNQYDSFALASDLMEPFRVIVEERVADLERNSLELQQLTRDTKRSILEPFVSGDDTTEKDASAWVALARMTVSLRNVYEGGAESLRLPDFQL